jgi:6-phosphogluconolactonase
MRRRRLLQLGLGALPLPLIGARPAMADTSPETTVYVSNAGSKDIYVLAMNRATGALDLIEKVPVPGTDKPSPASLPMAKSRDNRFLYAQLRSAPYPVSTFAIDPTTGQLTYLDMTPLVDQMAYITVDGYGKYLLCASYVGAKLAIYPIDPTTGIVQPTATQILDTNPKAHCVVIDRAGKQVYVPVLGGDEILEFNYNMHGVVAPDGPGRIATAPGAGPRHFTIHPNTIWGYLITETTATIGAYGVDAQTGILTEMQFVATGDYDGTNSAAASDIHVTPDGRFLYGAVRTTSTLHGYAIDPDHGLLTPIGNWPTETTPRGFNIDPRGKFLLSAGMNSGAMTVHAIDPTSGALTPVHRYAMGIQPNWVEIIDLA